ncbi:menaquinone biosynthesis decarboxylase [Halothermothrix orenii]|uniref:UbiD family decarboxylase n=1 Tax=Halothermothrix orenii (strain H 168 / OCM 544 / DSM 9562) TaxID=373903 RepID=B8CY62_HALOH|nr:menaquinone biosynthesis decarboxylase [Halothermothrix orenii]ACL70231.1 UbiD family decarboxylase [Halothermothrix orenii H 168]
MAYRDLSDFIKTLERENELVRVGVEVDPVLEITEITDRVVKNGGPALLFENVKGSDFPVLINAFGSIRRMELALEAESLDDIGDRINQYLQLPTPENFLDKLKMLPLLKELGDFLPRTVKKAPCQEVVEENVDLGSLPILKCWPGDGGRYITLPLVFTKDPGTGRQNVGMYRLQVFDKKTTGMHWHIHKDGAENYRKHLGNREKMEVAVAIGADPATIYAATAPLPAGIDEMLFAGFLRKEPVEMVKCRTVDLKVPANAEIILEGYVKPGELRKEGPFGDHTGYYSLVDEYPVFHVQAITRRNQPVYNATVVGKPPMEDCFMAKATERIFLPLLKMQLPEIVDMNLPLEGVFHNCAIISIKKSYPGHAKKVMHALWGLGQMMYTKMIIVVDEDVDVQDLSTVAWKVFNNIDARRDVVIVDGPLDALDHSSPVRHYGSKMGIDATKAWPEEGHTREWPPEIEMNKKIKKLVDKRWQEYGINI